MLALGFSVPARSRSAMVWFSFSLSVCLSSLKLFLCAMRKANVFWVGVYIVEEKKWEEGLRSDLEASRRRVFGWSKRKDERFGSRRVGWAKKVVDLTVEQVMWLTFRRRRVLCISLSLYLSVFLVCRSESALCRLGLSVILYIYITWCCHFCEISSLSLLKSLS